MGEKVHRIYLLVKGDIAKLTPKLEKIALTRKEYEEYLILLKQYNEEYLLSKCFDLNQYTYRVQMDKLIGNNNQTELKGKVSKSNSINNISIEFPNKSYNSTFYNENQITYKEDYLTRLNINLSSDIKEKRENVFIFKYYYVQNMKQSNIFGAQYFTEKTEKL